MSTIKDQVGHIHYLTSEPLHTEANSFIYLIRPEIGLTKMIADQIRRHKDLGDTSRNYGVFFVPRKTLLCERVLSEQGVHGDCKLGSFQMDLIPFDDDVLSLEMSAAFSECFLDGDPSALQHIARAISRLQDMFGIIGTVKGKGDQAYQVFRHLERMRREQQTPMGAFGALSDIDALLLIDRTVDSITPMLQQMTYEGLVDEQFGIKNTYIDVSSELVGGQQAPSGPNAAPTMKKLALNSNDTLFKEIRDFHFRVLGPFLHKKAASIKETYSERYKTQTVGEMHSFVQKFKVAHNEHNYLQTHINVAEFISQTTKKVTYMFTFSFLFNDLLRVSVFAVDLFSYFFSCISLEDLHHLEITSLHQAFERLMYVYAALFYLHP